MRESLTSPRNDVHEPVNLIEWRLPRATEARGRLYTCGRPGHGTPGFGRTRRRVDDHTIELWVKGLPKADVLHIVSLLDKKTNAFSEFGYYPFRSSKESGTKPTFQEWLDANYERRFVVHEFPTIDARGISRDVLAEVTRRVLELIGQGNTVVVIDSAGAERTARVREAIGYTEVRRGGIK
jgi:hypothetical protein